MSIDMLAISCYSWAREFPHKKETRMAKVPFVLACVAFLLACLSSSFIWWSYSQAACQMQANQQASIVKLRREQGDQFADDLIFVLRKQGLLQDHWWCQ
jgi:cytochrome c-type biogenesis protein CcmH/NrfG